MATVEIKNPDAPMTDKQTYKLYMITGVTMYYMDEYPYSVQQASDLIDRAMNGEAYHVRVETAEHEGSKVSWTDVGKSYRSDPKPKGYAHAMVMLTGDEDDEPEVSEESTPAKQGKTKAQKRAALTAKYEHELRALDTPTQKKKNTPKPKSQDTPKPKSSGNDKPTKEEGEDAVYQLLAETSGIDIEKIRRMAAAFSS